MKRLSLCSTAVACLTVASLSTIGRAAQESRTPDISGFWELNFDGRQVPRASLLPSVTRAKTDARAKGDAYAVRWCNLLGVPFVMDSGRPLDIRQGATAIIIAPENSSAPRYLYTNRAAHISEDIFDPSTNAWTSVSGGMVGARAGHTATLWLTASGFGRDCPTPRGSRRRRSCSV